MRRLAREAIIGLSAIVLRDDSAKVVFYHDVGRKWTPMGTYVETFWSHWRHLRPTDVVCFDDGFRGIWDEREKWTSDEVKAQGRDGIKRIVFLAVGLVGKPGYLTWDEVCELQDRYGFQFQCHTWSHQTLAGPFNDEVESPPCGRTDAWFRHELVDSKAEMESRLGSRVTALCFPVGHFSDDVVSRCKAAGYEKVYASYPGSLSDGYVQPRCLVQDISPTAFRGVLAGGMAPLAGWYRSRHFFS